MAASDVPRSALPFFSVVVTSLHLSPVGIKTFLQTGVFCCSLCYTEITKFDGQSEKAGPERQAFCENRVCDMPTILQGLKIAVRKLRWKLTLSYTAVTVGSLLVVVLAFGLLLFSIILVPRGYLTPEVWAQVVRREWGALWSYVLAQPDVDTDLVALTLRMGDSTLPPRSFQTSHLEPFRVGHMQFQVRTVGTGDVLLVDAGGTLLGISTPSRFPTAQVGQPIDPDLLPGLGEPLEAALAGEEDPDRLFVTIKPDQEFFFIVPLRDEQDTQRVVGAGIVYVEDLPTDRNMPADLAALLGIGLLVVLLAAGLVGTIFGSVTANGMVKRFQRVSSASEAWSRGDFSEFIEDSAGDEISQLAHRLNRMAEQLQDLLTRRQEMAISEERNRLARDLHDSAKQQALAASFQLGTAITLFEREPQAAREHLTEADALVDEVRKELTDLIHELRPQTMDGQNLADVLREYAVDWAHRSGIEIEVDVQEQGLLPLESEQTLYRIAQEALANVARHSAAKHVDLLLSDEAGVVTMEIADDGCGFDPRAEHAGMGLVSMRERAQALNGDVVIESEPGRGTHISVTLPVA
jgi:NarL family two-component system sensor histidine kinase LiaS